MQLVNTHPQVINSPDNAQNHSLAHKEALMTHQAKPQESVPKNKAISIVRQIAQWSILALLLFTCIMAAYRKFGG
jgi:hypothetical protein